MEENEKQKRMLKINYSEILYRSFFLVDEEDFVIKQVCRVVFKFVEAEGMFVTGDLVVGGIFVFCDSVS